jgi:hypothetical protein
MELGILVCLVSSCIASSVVTYSTSALYVVVRIVVVRIVVLLTSIRRPQGLFSFFRIAHLVNVLLVATYAAYCLF